MLTTDFLGAYDYEAEEARAEADYLLQLACAEGWTAADCEAQKAKTLAHWQRILSPSVFAVFAAHFQAAIARATTGA